MSTEIYKKIKFSDVINRIMDVFKLHTRQECAEFLGMSYSNLSDRRRRQSVPVDRITAVIVREGGNPAYFLHGTKPIWSDRKIKKAIQEITGDHVTPVKIEETDQLDLLIKDLIWAEVQNKGFWKDKKFSGPEVVIKRKDLQKRLNQALGFSESDHSE